MKRESLMIGDWVYVPHGGRASHNGKVEAIYESGTISVELEGAGCLCRAESLDPIQLTAEILEKNGFKKSIFRDIEGQHQWSWWRDTLTVVCLWMRELNDNPTDGWMIRIESTPAACCLKISSVHELQHTLKLCGIEKEIVLHE